MVDHLEAARSACKAAINAAGGGAKLGRELGVTRFAVHQWEVVPAKRLADVARVTGIPAADLRPDLAAAFAPREVA